MPVPVNVDQLTFPKASAMAAKVLAYLSDSDPDIDEVDNLILSDPVLAGTIIRYANSPLYRRGGEISNVPTATRLIGLKNVRSAVVMTALRATSTADSVLSKVILDHLLAIAAISKIIARKCCPQSADDLELMGLIHDVGMIVLATNFENEYKELVVRSRNEGLAIDKLEQETFGINHDQIAVRALHEFRLPKRHETVLTHFHQETTELDAEMVREKAVLMLAHGLLAGCLGDQAFAETSHDTVDGLASTLQLDDASLDDIRGQVSEFVAGIV